MSEKFSEDYYLRGPQTGLSNYENYRWLPEPTILCARRMMNHLGAHPGDSVLDWGCARGYYVKALRILGYDATGYDLSRWAVENCDPDVAGLVSNKQTGKAQDWVVCKDVLEHVPLGQIGDSILRLLMHAKKGVLIVVPLAKDGVYINPADRQDSTHVLAWTMDEWLNRIQTVIDDIKYPMTVSGGYKLPGVKQAADPFPMSTAFITIRRYHK
jgi:hypothetical protein